MSNLNLEHNSIAKDESIKIVYVPSHLYHMVFELMKNSLRAVVEHHGTECSTYPPVEAKVVLGKEDISISVRIYEAKITDGSFCSLTYYVLQYLLQISDKGGGIPRKNTDLLFQYMVRKESSSRK